MRTDLVGKTIAAIVGLDWDIVDLVDSLTKINLVGVIDNVCPKILPFSYLGKDSDWNQIIENHPNLMVILAVDNPKVRAKLFFECYASNTLTIKSSEAYFSSRAFLGEGSIVQRGVTVMPYVQIGNGCKLNINVTVHHEATIGSFVTLAPGCQILGRVVIEDQVYVGAGAIIKQNCRIGTGSIIGAGAVVVNDIPPESIVVGIPAKPL